MKDAILKTKIQQEVTDLMVKTRATNIILGSGGDEDEKLLIDKIQEIVTALNTKAKSTDVQTWIATAVSNAKDELIGGAPSTYDTLKEIADYIEQHQDVVQAISQAIGQKVDKVEGKGLSTNDFTDELKSTVETFNPSSYPSVSQFNSLSQVVTQLQKTVAELQNQGGGVSLEDVYPVGSVYLNHSTTANPATLLGFGTWMRLQDAYLYACSGSPLSRTAGNGTSFYVEHDNMPSHSHALPDYGKNYVQNTGSITRHTVASGSGAPNMVRAENAFSYTTPSPSTTRAGSDIPITYMPEYWEVVCWYRTA